MCPRDACVLSPVAWPRAYGLPSRARAPHPWAWASPASALRVRPWCVHPWAGAALRVRPWRVR
eukprot:2359608-Alexandrium_andersonii.AAC.1